MVNNQIVTVSETFNSNDFWQLWQEYRDYLYARCLKWMGGNPMEAEDALSRAMLKAWEKVQQYAGKITNLKAWLTRLTHNLCVDIHREHSRGANRVEDIEAIPEEKGLVSCEDIPLRALETEERKMMIRGAIDNLPIRLRETFILHFYHQYSHQEIAQQQDISYANVCKRISQGRKILREELTGYFNFRENTQIHTEKSNKTEDVPFDLNTSIFALGDKNQKEALSYQLCSNLIPAGEAEPNEETSQAYVIFEPFVSKTVNKQISEENHEEEKEELSIQKQFSFSQGRGNNSQNFKTPPSDPESLPLIIASNKSNVKSIWQQNRIAVVNVLSPAKLTAWEKVQQYAGKITNFKVCLIPSVSVKNMRKRLKGAKGKSPQARLSHVIITPGAPAVRTQLEPDLCSKVICIGGGTIAQRVTVSVHRSTIRRGDPLGSIPVDQNKWRVQMPIRIQFIQESVLKHIDGYCEEKHPFERNDKEAWARFAIDIYRERDRPTRYEVHRGSGRNQAVINTYTSFH